MKIIARIYNDFKEKFGIPRQSGISEGISKIVFEPEYRRKEAFSGIEGYSHLWIIWQFSEAVQNSWSPTVRPPRLGGNRRVGVFATRSPYRPNPIGLSSVKLLNVEYSDTVGPVLYVCGADILDGTPIYDIKPYLAYTDSHPEAVGGFSDGVRDYKVEVSFPSELLLRINEELRDEIVRLLENDPRPSYKGDCDRVYGMRYGNYEIHFRANDGKLLVVGVDVFDNTDTPKTKN